MQTGDSDFGKTALGSKLTKFLTTRFFQPSMQSISYRFQAAMEAIMPPRHARNSLAEWRSQQRCD